MPGACSALPRMAWLFPRRMSRAWRRTAAQVHPDRRGPAAVDLAALKQAAQRLGGLLRGGPAQTREGLRARAGLHLVLPELASFRPTLEAVA